LPTAGVAEHLAGFHLAEDAGGLAGVAGLEQHGDTALLRSVTVREDQRGSGLGQRLTRHALDAARRRGARQVVLLTTTAGQFFPRFGFRVVTRDDVPQAVKQSVEFTGACPASATVMLLDLEGVPAGRVA
ncbi:MAG TPA: arsenic resistance N-acetyltransferase ArsN2, partial [Deinococcales bacterium]|nr:arsenic resistance N-acetyltransferase ArsN2 [Deinococcales bacterium]